MLKAVSVLLACSLFFSAASTAQSIEGKEFDVAGISSGAVGARYIPSTEKRIKTRVQRDTGKYDYDLFGRNDFEYFPLQLGNGKYKVTIFENIKDNKYRVAKSKDMTIKLKDPISVYLASVQTVNWNMEMAVIKKGLELTKDLKTDKDKINAIYNYVVDCLSYDYDKLENIDSTYVPDIEQVINDEKGICYDYSAVFAAMLRSQDIPCKLIKGYSTNVKEYHAWNEVYLADESRWMIVDTTYDSVLKKNGKKTRIEKEKEKYKMSREY